MLFLLPTQCLICMLDGVEWKSADLKRWTQHMLIVHKVDFEPEA